MSLEGLILLLILWFVLDRMSKAARRRAAPPAEAETVRVRSGPREGVSEEEEITLESLLEEVRRAKRGPAGSPPPRRPVPRPRVQPSRQPPGPATERGPVGRRARAALPSAEEVEERESLEVEPQVVSYDELVGSRPARAVEDLDETAEAVVRRRIAEAEARNREHRPANHEAFHQKIAADAGAPMAPPRLSPAQLRSALVWREILGPPKAEEL